jgi:cell wall-associated NlpC family hydrolase
LVTNASKHSASSGVSKPKQSREKLVARIFAAVLALLFILMVLSQTLIYAFAAELDDVEELRSRQQQLEEQQSEYQSQLDDLEEQQESAVQQYQLLEEQNRVIADEIDNSTELIQQYEEQIAASTQELEDAQQEREDYYQLYCDRIVEIEQGEHFSIWNAIFSAASFTELLTTIHDMQSIQEYDSNVLAEMERLEEDISDKQEKLQKEKEEQEAVLDDLKTQKAELDATEEKASALVEEIKRNIDFYNEQLSAIEVECSDLEEDIVSAEEAAAAKAAAEEAAKAVEEAREAEAKRAAQQEAEEAEEEETTSVSQKEDKQESVKQESTKKESAKKESTKKDKEEKAPATSQETSSEPEQEEEEEQETTESTPSNSSGITGADVVAYGVQFLGNPYVWGGTSLTNGCDCSGFVMSVYGHFGYSLPHFSGSIRSCGIGVSYSEAIAGDIICYDGHVGIYMGNGQMVNAFDTKHGIIICSVNTSRLIAVRRIIY